MDLVKKEVKFVSASCTPAGMVSIELETMRTETVSLHHVGGGEWRASDETALHKCALCGVAVAGGSHPAHLINALLADHHAVCEGRPVEVGEWVEIPRPGAGEQATVFHCIGLPSEHCSRSASTQQGGRLGWRCPEHAAAFAAEAHQRALAPRCACGDDHQPVDPAVTQTDHPATKDAGRYREQLAPAFVDGLTRAECLERYTDNMQRADDSIPWPLTPAQRTVACVEWDRALRAKVDASREAERNRVTYCEVDCDD